jgi:hypothetical protein
MERREIILLEIPTPVADNFPPDSGHSGLVAAITGRVV